MNRKTLSSLNRGTEARSITSDSVPRFHPEEEGNQVMLTIPPLIYFSTMRRFRFWKEFFMGKKKSKHKTITSGYLLISHIINSNFSLIHIFIHSFTHLSPWQVLSSWNHLSVHIWQRNTAQYLIMASSSHWINFLLLWFSHNAK